MNISIIIPAHNEKEAIEHTLRSLVNQSLLPFQVLVVDDQSTDGTAEVVADFAREYPFVSVMSILSASTHLPGSKIIRAFQQGYEQLEKSFDVICKFDADLVFPKEYLETISRHFEADPEVGMAGGFCYIQKNGKWILENLTGKDHLRGALKAYRTACFREIGGLQPSMGWDTLDELLAQYHGWKIKTDPSLRVKHLRPTGQTYHKSAKSKQGAAFYMLRYGLFLTAIAAGKLALKKKNPILFKDYMLGFFQAWIGSRAFLVSKKEGAFIRRLRYKKMLQKIF